MVIASYILINMENSGKNVQIIVTRSTKSVGIGLLLTFIFGPIGMLYATVWGGFIMMVVNLLIGIPTLGLGLLLTWPIQLIWVAVSIRSYNRKLMNL